MKRLIVCCDGTWQKPIQNWRGREAPSNIARLAARVAKNDGACSQVVWYDQGVGTGNGLDLLAGGIWGSGLVDNLIEGYRFLVSNYEPGDELYLFGFSRGAYTVRSLAGMIRKCGIVRRDKLQSYQPAVDLYRDGSHPEEKGPRVFRADVSVMGTHPIPIRFIGVFDTVGALGIPGFANKRHQFHDTRLSRSVQNAYQALAVDERRKTFEPTLWSDPKPGCTLEQVWFSGTHSDVGGGIASKGLPDLSLQWMLEKAELTGLALDPAVRGAWPLEPDPSAPMNPIERSWFWSALGFTERSIGVDTQGVPDGTQSLHPSVAQRWESIAGYRPGNLSQHFAPAGRPRRPERDLAAPEAAGSRAFPLG